MLVSLIKKDRIYSVSLPMQISGTYWVSDLDKYGNERKLVSIEERGDTWVLKSNNDNRIIEEDRIINEITLQNFSFHYLQIENEEIALLYTCPVYDKNNMQLEVRTNQEILIGKSNLCKIVYNLPTVSNEHAKIIYNNNSNVWQIMDLNSKFGTYVNNERITAPRVLRHGDIIFISGIKATIRNGIIKHT